MKSACRLTGALFSGKFIQIDATAFVRGQLKCSQIDEIIKAARNFSAAGKRVYKNACNLRAGAVAK